MRYKEDLKPIENKHMRLKQDTSFERDLLYKLKYNDLASRIKNILYDNRGLYSHHRI